MQIEQVAAHVAAATGKAGATATKSANNASGASASGTGGNSSNKSTNTAGDTAAADPVTGGTRTTTSVHLFGMDVDIDLPLDFADIVAEKTRLFATTLKDLFTGLGVRMDEPITLSMDSAGRVTASGPGKAKIEQMFADNPELTKQLKEVMVLQSMLAMKMALDKWQEAHKDAKTDDDRDKADQSLMRDLGTIKALRSTMVLSPDGSLISAALAYMNGSR